MISDFGKTKYCKRCGKEKVGKDELVTMSKENQFCECDGNNKNG